MMIYSRTLGLSFLFTAVALGGCATTNGTDSPAHDNTDAVVWLQSSAEYAAVTTGIYRMAAAALEHAARAEATRSRPMAVVMDIDETVLDNARYQGQLVLNDTSYDSASWDAWIELRSASAVPGVVEFIETSQALGIHVAFITNRSCRARPGSTEDCPQRSDTLANLAALGIDTSSTTLFLRGDRPAEECRVFLSDAERSDGGTWSSDKTSRAQCVKLEHDIVMLFGDQLGDFTDVQNRSADGSVRELAASGEWGKTWFMLPNPTYGGWRPRDSLAKRELIMGIN